MNWQVHAWQKISLLISKSQTILSVESDGLGGSHFLWKGVPNLQKVGINKISNPPLFQQKKKKNYDPHHWYTLLPKQAKIVLKSVFLNKINTICGHLVTPNILVIKNFITPLFFFPKIYDPPAPCIFGTPHSEDKLDNMSLHLL